MVLAECRDRMQSWTLIAFHSASHSSHPSRDSIARTFYSYCFHRQDFPYSQHGRHADPRHQVRHSLPLPRHKAALEYSTSDHRNSYRHTFGLRIDLEEIRCDEYRLVTFSRLEGNVGVQFCCSCDLLHHLPGSLVPQPPSLPSSVD